MDKKGALCELRKLCCDIAAREGDVGKAARSSEVFPAFWTQEDGAVHLSGTDDERFRSIAAALLKHMGERASERAIRGLIHDAIFKTLDRTGKSIGTTTEARAEGAVRDVNDALALPPARWLACIPLFGLSAPQVPWIFGDIVIADFASDFVRDVLGKADGIIESTISPGEHKAAVKSRLRTNLVGNLDGQVLAFATVYASDSDAAWASAKRKTRFVLDCLNFALDVLPVKSPSFELSDRALGGPVRFGFVLNSTDNSSLHDEHDLSGSAGRVNGEELKIRIAADVALSRMIDFLSTPKPNGHQKRVLTAIHWAGRAAVLRRPDESFLYWAISLESLILGNKDAEITTRLALCVTHLLGSWLRDRKGTVAHLKRLYGVRSKIVHAGEYEVLPEDHARLRRYALMSFQRVLEDAKFQKMEGQSGLDEWFEAALRGDAS